MLKCLCSLLAFGVVCIFPVQAQCTTGAGSALRFDGVDDYVELGAGDLLSAPEEFDFTLEAWIRVDCGAVGNGFAVSTAYQPFCSDAGYTLFAGEGTPPSSLLGNHVAQPGCGNDGGSTSLDRTCGEWHHVASTFERTSTLGSLAIGTLRLYVDGVLRDELFDQALGMEAQPVLKFGTLNDASHAPLGGYFHGDLDEVRIWSRARSGAEIVCTMNTTLTGYESDLVGYWPFSEGAGQATANLGNPSAWSVPLAWNGDLGGTSAPEASDPQWIPSDAPVCAPLPVEVYCAGDGSAAACPCGNESPSASGDGCLNSHGTGGRLGVVGVASLGADTLTLSGSQMTSSFCIYVQATDRSECGVGTLFGDGLLCVTGNVVRLGARLNAAGASQLPSGAEPTISARSSTQGDTLGVGMIRHYQTWYRNPASFCTPDGFNLTNGVSVIWGP